MCVIYATVLCTNYSFFQGGEKKKKIKEEKYATEMPVEGAEVVSVWIATQTHC